MTANPLAILRHNAQILGWVSHGCPVPPPPAVKRRILAAYQQKHDLQVFIETGTFKGDTLDEMAGRVKRAISIELSDEFHARARKRFEGRKNIELLHGDSGDVLPPLVASLREPALFWLDGHYSAGDTAHGIEASPISRELDSILASPVAGHVVLIDDVDQFSDQGGYPEIGRLITSLTAHGRFHCRIEANILILEPRKAA
jgi:hypothetical protein